MAAHPVIAVDALGGDYGPGPLREGAALAAAAGVRVVLVGGDDANLPPGVGWVAAGDGLPMDSTAADVRRRPDAPVRVAMGLVARGGADAVVSCGSSGATLVSAVLDLGMAAGVERPALLAVLPRADGHDLHVLDVGASIEVRAEHLVHFAALGDAWASVVGGTTARVGLLANGTESYKGTRAVREADEILRRIMPNYIGKVEPHAAFVGAVDVLVCDGFAGNVLIKTAEGVVTMLGQVFRAEAMAVGLELRAPPSPAEAAGSAGGPTDRDDPAPTGDPRRAAAGEATDPIGDRGPRPTSGRPEGADGAADASLRALFARLRRRVDWRSRGGAVLLGARAPVVVGHGRADPVAVDAAIRLAHYACSHGLVDDVNRRLAALGSLAAPADGGAGRGAGEQG